MAGFLLRCRPDAVECDAVGSGLGLVCRVVRFDGGALVVYGDPLAGADAPDAPPADAPLDVLTAWTERCWSRYCAVLVRHGRATLWSDIGATCPLHYARGADDTLLIGTSAGTVSGPSPVLGSAEQSLLPGGRFAGVTAVPADTAVTLVVDSYDTEPVSVRRLRHLPDKPTVTDPDEAVRTVREALTASVTRLVDGADEVGVTLSGGVDSSTVAALTARTGAVVRTYTVGTPYGDEFAQAAWLAERLGTKHEELVFRPDRLAELLPGMIRALETWDLDTLQIAAPTCFLLDHTAADRRQVLLTGYGADLLFAGLGGSGDEADTERAVVAQTAATARSNEFNPAFADARHTAVRFPYWTPEVMATALGIRGRLKVRDGTAKWVLRSAAEAVLPAEVAWRPKRAIHEGTAMSRMFTEVLGSDDRRAQAERLQSMAAEIFRGRGRSKAPQASSGTGTDEGEGSHEGLAGLAS